MNKKGSILDMLYVGIILIVFAVVTLIGYKVFNEWNTEFQANTAVIATDIDGNARSSANQIENTFPGVIDNSFLLLTVGLGIAALILAAMVRIHPIFFVFYIILLCFVIFFSAIFSNIYQEIAANPEFTALADNLTFITLLLHALPLIIGIFGTVLAIVMYKAWQEAQVV